MSTSPESIEAPPLYRDLASRLEVVGVEEARAKWGALAAAAEGGTITLITRERWVWTALVPLAEVTDPLDRMPVWSLSAAKAKLGDLVRAAGDWQPTSHILARRGQPVAALIAARHLVDRPTAAERFDVEQLLQDGHTITLGFDPGQEGAVDERGDVSQEPWPACYWAKVHAHTGTEIASGAADTLPEALLRLHPVQPLIATVTADGDPWEPPF